MEELVYREKKIYNLKCELEKRKRHMMEKSKLLKDNLQDNKFLKVILDDYKEYYNYIISVKKKQLQQFTFLKNYLEKTNSELKTIDINMERAKLDYKDINNEISKLKLELNQIISNSNINE
tara:strand:+ start:216 stop:578 length:363 start_codon:yes stop_codon:yes gene_type:complete